MDEQGQAELVRQVELGLEPGDLLPGGGKAVGVVQPGLPHGGDQLRPGLPDPVGLDQRPQPTDGASGRRAVLPGMVGVHPHGGPELQGQEGAGPVRRQDPETPLRLGHGR